MTRALVASPVEQFTVYWRSRDSQGSHVWRTGLTAAEADANVVWCEAAHPEATMVWSVACGSNQARYVSLTDHRALDAARREG